MPSLSPQAMDSTTDDKKAENWRLAEGQSDSINSLDGLINQADSMNLLGTPTGVSAIQHPRTPEAKSPSLYKAPRFQTMQLKSPSPYDNLVFQANLTSPYHPAGYLISEQDLNAVYSCSPSASGPTTPSAMQLQITGDETDKTTPKPPMKGKWQQDEDFLLSSPLRDTTVFGMELPKEDGPKRASKRKRQCRQAEEQEPTVANADNNAPSIPQIFLANKDMTISGQGDKEMIPGKNK